MQSGFGCGERGGNGARNIVERVAVLGNGRSAGHDFRQSAGKRFRADVLLYVQKVGIAVEVVKVLGERKVQRRAHILVGFVSRHNRREVDCKLLVAYRVHQHRFVHGLKRSDSLLLLLFDAARKRELAAQIVVYAVACKGVGEPYRLELGAVCEDCPHARVWVDFHGVVGRSYHVLAREEKRVGLFGAYLKGIHCCHYLYNTSVFFADEPRITR